MARKAPRTSDDDALFSIEDLEVALTDVALVENPPRWPDFSTTERVTTEQKLLAAQTLVDFIDAGFPAQVWKAGHLGLLHRGPFSTTYDLSDDKYWDKNFSSTARQADWLSTLSSEHRLRNQRGGNDWADVEHAVLVVIRTRGYWSALRAEGRVMWTPQLSRGGKGSGKQYSFESTQLDTAKEKAAFATTLIRFIETGFPQSRWSRPMHRRLTSMFFHEAHDDHDGFYAEWFSNNSNQLLWFENARTHGTRWDEPRLGNPEHGDFQSWRDVEAALVDTMKDRGFEAEWRRKLLLEAESQALPETLDALF